MWSVKARKFSNTQHCHFLMAGLECSVLAKKKEEQKQQTTAFH
jgi:hypothetical protein